MEAPPDRVEAVPAWCRPPLKDVALGRDRDVGPPLEVEGTRRVRCAVDGVLFVHQHLHRGVGGRRPGVVRRVVELRAVAGSLREGREDPIVRQRHVGAVPALVDHVGEGRPGERVRIEGRSPPILGVAAGRHDDPVLEGRDPRAEHVVEVAVDGDEGLVTGIEDRGVGELGRAREGVGLGGRPSEDTPVGQVGRRDRDLGPGDHRPPLPDRRCIRGHEDQLAIRGDRLEVGVARAVPHLEDLPTELLEELDPQRVGAGAQGGRALHQHGRVQTVVVNDEVAVDEETRAVVGVREELVVARGRYVDLLGEDQPVRLGLPAHRLVDHARLSRRDGRERIEVRQDVPLTVVDFVVEERCGRRCPAEHGAQQDEQERTSRGERARGRHGGALSTRSGLRSREGRGTMGQGVRDGIRVGSATTRRCGCKAAYTSKGATGVTIPGPRRLSPARPRCLSV